MRGLICHADIAMTAPGAKREINAHAWERPPPSEGAHPPQSGAETHNNPEPAIPIPAAIGAQSRQFSKC